MDEIVRNELAAIVARDRDAAETDPRRTVAMLRDTVGEHTLEITLLDTAVQDGVIEQLLATSMPAEVAVGRLADQQVRNRGLSRENAYWAVESWAVALGLAAPHSPAPESGHNVVGASTEGGADLVESLRLDHIGVPNPFKDHPFHGLWFGSEPRPRVTYPDSPSGYDRGRRDLDVIMGGRYPCPIPGRVVSRWAGSSAHQLVILASMVRVASPSPFYGLWMGLRADPYTTWSPTPENWQAAWTTFYKQTSGMARFRSCPLCARAMPSATETCPSCRGVSLPSAR